MPGYLKGNYCNFYWRYTLSFLAEPGRKMCKKGGTSDWRCTKPSSFLSLASLRLGWLVKGWSVSLHRWKCEIFEASKKKKLKRLTVGFRKIWVVIFTCSRFHMLKHGFYTSKIAQEIQHVKKTGDFLEGKLRINSWGKPKTPTKYDLGLKAEEGKTCFSPSLHPKKKNIINFWDYADQNLQMARWLTFLYLCFKVFLP